MPVTLWVGNAYPHRAQDATPGMTAVMVPQRRLPCSVVTRRLAMSGVGTWVSRATGLLRDPARPPLFSVVFWLCFLVRYVVVLVRPDEFAAPYGRPAVFTAHAVVVGLWLALPWEARARWRRKVVVVLFPLAVLVAGVVGGDGTDGVLVFIALANVAFLFGVRVGMVLAALVLTVLTVAVLTLPLGSRASALWQTFALGITAACVLGLVTAELRARRLHEQASELARQLASANAELRRYSARVRDLTVVEERARLARDMHDSVGHGLTIIKIRLENAERFRHVRPDEAWSEVRLAKDLAGQAITDARRWARALRPLALDGTLGTAALQRLTRSFRGTGLNVQFTVEGRERALDADTELVLYRVLQEGLTNALRHGGAGAVRVRLCFEEERVALTIGSHGEGMAVPEAGFGLVSLAERARAVGGVLTIDGAPGSGFSLGVELPAGQR